MKTQEHCGAMRSLCDSYYAANFPPRLYIHIRDGAVNVSTSDSPLDL